MRRASSLEIVTLPDPFVTMLDKLFEDNDTARRLCMEILDKGDILHTALNANGMLVAVPLARRKILQRKNVSESGAKVVCLILSPGVDMYVRNRKIMWQDEADKWRELEGDYDDNVLISQKEDIVGF